jgi:CheY-like chemotaxis protein
MARSILKQNCEALGWHATTLDSGAACLDELVHSAAEGRYYDILLLDWRMPDMNGLEMLRQANRTPGIGLPLVVLMASVFELEQAAAESDDLHLDGIVAKPLTPAILLEAVKRAYSGDPVDIEPPPGKSNQKLAGKRLLVAEDNEINRILIEKILSRDGAEVVLAVNGRAAVEILKAPGALFDAVLMDLQMPVMDGFSAAQVIRGELGLVDLPIIAVTAHALAEDYEKCRQVGMQELIVKPIDVERLLSILRRKSQSSSDPHSGETKSGMGSEAPSTDISCLDLPAVSAFGWDKKTFGSMLDQFVGQHSGDVVEAQRLFCAGEAKAAARLIHQLRGVTSFLRATEVSRLAALTETELLFGKPERVNELFVELLIAMGRLDQSIAQIQAMLLNSD